MQTNATTKIANSRRRVLVRFSSSFRNSGNRFIEKSCTAFIAWSFRIQSRLKGFSTYNYNGLKGVATDDRVKIGAFFLEHRHDAFPRKGNQYTWYMYKQAIMQTLTTIKTVHSTGPMLQFSGSSRKSCEAFITWSFLI